MSALHSRAASNPSKYFVYVGTYGKGVYAYRYDVNGPKLEPLGLVGEVTNPSFLASDDGFHHLYAASELEGRVDGAVAAFAIDRKTGALKALNSESAAGQSPCHLTLDRTAKMLMVANYGTGSVAVFPVEAEGRLGKMSGLMTAAGSSIDPRRQKGPHAHQTVVSDDNRFVYVPDLGLDQVRIYRLDPTNAKLTPNDPPFAKLEAGYGPRHIAFSPNGKFAYVVNELKSFVTVFSRDKATGALTPIQSVSTLPDDFHSENAPAEIEIDRAGKYVYASNRGPGTIAVFAVNSDGTLKRTQVAPTGGTAPRGFKIDPSGHYLLAGDQKADQFVVFRVDPQNGQLSLSGQVFNVPSPVDFLFVPAQ